MHIPQRSSRCPSANFFVCVLLAFVFVATSAYAVEPRLHAAGARVTSIEPPASVTVPESAQYLGEKRWVLYGYADCDLQLYADKDASNTVERLYWIQSEGYIPSRPELTHAKDYLKSRKLELGGLDFHLDTWNRKLSDAAPADSDLAEMEKLVAARGLSLPANMSFVRLVHLPDKAARKELMIIYGERLADAKGAISGSDDADVVTRMKSAIKVEASTKR